LRKVEEYRLPVLGTVRLVWDIFKRQWWKLLLIEAIHSVFLVAASYLIKRFDLPVANDISELCRHLYTSRFWHEGYWFVFVSIAAIIGANLLLSWVIGMEVNILTEPKPQKRLSFLRVSFKALIFLAIWYLLWDAVSCAFSFLWVLFDESSLWVQWLVFVIWEVVTFVTFVFFLLVPFILVVERKGLFAAVGGSWRRVAPHFWRVLLLVLPFELVMRWLIPLPRRLLAPTVFSEPSYEAFRNWSWLLVGTSGMGVLAGIVLMAFRAAIYIRLQEEDETILIIPNQGHDRS
jgi:hypothetical protein